MRRAVQLLFELKLYDKADQMLSKLAPAALEGLGPDLKKMLGTAVRNQDFDGALEIARKSVAARPEDFRERLWLAEILRLSGRLPDAEIEFRQAVKLAGGLFDPWVVLVQFLTRTDQLEKAEAALREAKAALPKDQVALAMGRVRRAWRSLRDQGEAGRSQSTDRRCQEVVFDRGIRAAQRSQGASAFRDIPCENRSNRRGTNQAPCNLAKPCPTGSLRGRMGKAHPGPDLACDP